MESNNEIRKSKNNIINMIKSKLILKQIFNILTKNRFLLIIRNNKELQNKLNINIYNYKEYSEIYTKIIIEIIPVPNKYGKFINFVNKELIPLYHIYFNDRTKETDRNKRKNYSIYKKDKITKIKIIIEHQVKSFYKLFYDCKCIGSLRFIKFSRNNINNSSNMFFGCTLLKEIDLSNFKTENIKDMSYMFYKCESLQNLNLINFDTSNVTKMNYMFFRCLSLQELDLSNFNTTHVTDMSYMFFECQSLIKLNVSKFNTENVTSMYYMFSDCSSLKELDISNFNTINVTNIEHMFSYCRTLEKLTLCDFNIKNININDILYGCPYELKKTIEDKLKKMNNFL